MENKEIKKCKKCQEEINIKAKKCPKCGSKQGLPLWFIIVIFIIIIGIIAGGSGSDENGSKNSSSNTKTEQIREYIKISKDALDEALENNAASAKEKYDNQYVEVTGKLSTIDSDLKYISLASSTDDWDFLGIHCYIKNNDQKEIVKSLAKGQEITIRGKITDVGEVLGYYLDIIEIITN